MANPGTYKIIAKMQVQPEHLKTFKMLAAELVDKSSKEAGNLHYSLNSARKEPCLMVFTEAWRDKEAIRSHNESEHFARLLPQLLEFCAQEPVTEIYIEE